MSDPQDDTVDPTGDMVNPIGRIVGLTFIKLKEKDSHVCLWKLFGGDPVLRHLFVEPEPGDYKPPTQEIIGTQRENLGVRGWEDTEEEPWTKGGWCWCGADDIGVGIRGESWAHRGVHHGGVLGVGSTGGVGALGSPVSSVCIGNSGV